MPLSILSLIQGVDVSERTVRSVSRRTPIITGHSPSERYREPVHPGIESASASLSGTLPITSRDSEGSEDDPTNPRRRGDDDRSLVPLNQQALIQNRFRLRPLFSTSMKSTWIALPIHPFPSFVCIVSRLQKPEKNGMQSGDTYWTTIPHSS
jgi:hypothetical protein